MTDPYLLGSNALWAGDYDAALTYFATIAPEQLELADHHGPVKTSELLIKAQRRRARQLQTARDRFGKALMGLPREYRQIVPGGLRLIATRHLQGVLFRTSARGFEMRAYLTDFQWIKPLLENARRHTPQTQARPDLAEKISTGFSWEKPGDLFLEIHVSRLGLITAKGFWTQTEQPTSDALKLAFQQLLQELDLDFERPSSGSSREG